jgi:predicted RNA polymerase sigma factor
LLNRNDDAVEAFNRAASLTDDPALRDYLFKRAAANI